RASSTASAANRPIRTQRWKAVMNKEYGGAGQALGSAAAPSTVPGVRGNRIGVVLAGTGAFAPRHARAVAATEGLQLVAVVSRDRHRAEALARSHGAEGTD